MKKLLTIIGLAAAALAGGTQTQAAPLVAGGFAVIGFNDGGSPDSAVFVALQNIDAGTFLYLTDNGWTGTQFRGASATDGNGNEGLAAFNFSSAVSAGAVLSTASSQFVNSGPIADGSTGESYSDLAFSQSGDQIYGFLSSSTSNPLFNPTTQIFVWDNTSGFENATNSNEGGNPGLTGNAAMTGAFGQAGSFSLNYNDTDVTTLQTNGGTSAQWLAVIADATNWTDTASAGTAFTSFNVIPEPATWALLAGSLTVLSIFRRRRMNA